MNKKIFLFSGAILLLLGVSMLVFLAATFSYLGDNWEILSKIGEYCIALFIPTFLIGIILLIIGIVKN
ncbi:MAG: hypothetical protein REI64_05385 [Pedobacter sp.]|uniref:hypothetical protein n=1 Tax=Pedobacter sp. TaxID=1411316 RepID=UPI002806F7F9|nr:hypothetical protein [Pedobacter sp.]MDQ8004212.1 hypothetical protein [Pedobacter sp.]